MATTFIGRGAFIRLSGAAGAGLGLACMWPARAGTAAEPVFAPNAWVRVALDETITVVVSKSEMGQGVILGLPTILADEMDASMEHVRTEFAPADPAYVDPHYKDMVTGGSTSIAHHWTQLRQAGATARAMLVTAAAARWNVDAAQCTTRNGMVYHPDSRRSASYGSLANAAAAVPVPTDVPLKTPSQFALIGKPRQRPDIRHKVNGSVQYGIDVRIPGMQYAAVARSPVFGGKVQSFKAEKALAVKGVTQVVQVSNGVAVIGRNTWAAFQGRNALEIVWEEGPNAKLSTRALFAEAESLAKSHASEHIAVTRGTPDTTDGTVLEAIYRGPFLAHATMEPMNTTADVREDRCEIWSPNQVQLRALAAASAGSGLPREKCKIHTTFLGGGFGRRLEADYVQEAAEVSRVGKVPVKVMWSREDDTQHDFYRPMSVNVVRGVVKDGALTALTHQVVSPSWLRRWAPPLMSSGIDILDILEVIDQPYSIDNFKVAYIEHVQPVPVGSFRAPDANWNGFVTESFMDELAHAAGKDALAFRLSLLDKSPRAANVLRLAAEKAGWGNTPPAGRKRGLALTTWAGSYAGMVAEVSMQGKMPKVHRVVAAVDCGLNVNPDIVVQQAQSATNFGLSAALTGKITIAKGRVEQNNFYDYTVLHMADAPRIDVHVVNSTEPPTGIGEICVPPIGPAVANAVFALTGKRVRQLPFSDALG